MRLYTMKCIYDPELLPEEGGGMLGQKKYFIKIEDSFEETAYSGGVCGDEQAYADLNEYLQEIIGVTDEDVYYYFPMLEPDVEIGNTFEDADGLVWERVE